MGNLDRVLRMAVAVIIAALYFSGTLQGVTGIVLLILAAVFAVTGMLSFCPLYLPFRFSTVRNKRAKAH